MNSGKVQIPLTLDGGRPSWLCRPVHPCLPLTPFQLAAALILAALAGVLRFILLDHRPVMHDESLFAFRAFEFFQSGRLVHEPLMHGPTLLFLTGGVFSLFGDSMVAARGFLAVCSLGVILAALALWPRPVRWGLAPLIITSPILLYYSRFMRNDMLFCLVMMAGMVGIFHGLRRGPRQAPWAMAGMAALLSLLTIKENALFVYASGLTFAAVWMAIGLYRRLCGDTGAVGKGEEEAPLSRSAKAGVLRSKAALGWLSGAALGVVIILAVYGMATEDQAFAPLKNMEASWSYWQGQHLEHRISGELHYHLPILLTYELPVLLLLAAGLLLHAWWGRHWFIYGGAALAWILIWFAWRSLPPLAVVEGIESLLHIGPTGSMLVLGLVITPLLAFAFITLAEGRAPAAWMGWWSACSLFQYSVAGEKVPWLCVHIMLPLYLLLGWLWAPFAETWRGKGKCVAAAILCAVMLVALRNDYYLIGPRAADPGERIVASHTTTDYDRFCKEVLNRWTAKGSLAERRVLCVDDPRLGGPNWPSYWYFRHCLTQGLTQPRLDRIPPGTDLVLATWTTVQGLVPSLDPNLWEVQRFSYRDLWPAPWPEIDPVTAWLHYYWTRHPWSLAGHCPIIALQNLAR